MHANRQVKIGRQTNTKTVPGERNAYFDSKVLSRTHAEIWEQGGKVSAESPQPIDTQIFIKDVKSSNGTFINGVRLSPEGVESDPYQLNSEDMVVSLWRAISSSHDRSLVSILSARTTARSSTTRSPPRRTALWGPTTLPSRLGESLSSGRG